MVRFSIKPEDQDPLEVQFKRAIVNAGLVPPPSIILDGRIHRYATSDKVGDDSGWYVGFSDGIPAGSCGDWRTGQEVKWISGNRELSPAEKMAYNSRLQEIKHKNEIEREARGKRSAESCQYIWESAVPASAEHPYLKKKGVLPHFSRVTSDGRLILPLYDKAGELSSLQYIDGEGQKLYHPGAVVKGCFSILGEIGNKIFVTEGFATGATVFEVAELPVVVSYSAGNIEPVVGLLREKYPSAEIVIVADNDKSGVGKSYAEQAASKHGASVIIPPQVGDANDFHQEGGDLLGLLTPKEDSWLVDAETWSEQPAPISWLVKHWIQKDALIMVHGPSGAGKTFVILDWAMRMASGETDWLGNRVTQGNVVYLAGEGHHGLRGRIAAWKHYHRRKTTGLWVSRSGTDLNTPAGLTKAITAIRGTNPALIIVDTLHRFLLGDENSAEDAKTMLDACSRLMAEFGCSVLLVHHTGVSEEAQHRARGSSAWRGALDIEVSIRPEGDHGMVIEQKKCKDGEMAKPISVEREKVIIPGWFDEDGEPVGSAVVVQGVEKVKVDKALETKKKWIKDAWKGAMIDGKPYLSKEEIRAYLTDVQELKSADQYMKESSDKFIGYLLENQIIDKTDGGYIVIEGVLISSMLLR